MSLTRRVLRRPMLHVVGNGSKPHDPMTLELYPEGNSSFSLYEDDGVTRQHELGYFSSVDITMCDCPRCCALSFRLTVRCGHQDRGGQLQHSRQAGRRREGVRSGWQRVRRSAQGALMGPQRALQGRAGTVAPQCPRSQRTEGCFVARRLPSR